MMNKANVLIVEDDRAISNVINTALSMEGYHCMEAYNGADAQEQISQELQLHYLPKNQILLRLLEY